MTFLNHDMTFLNRYVTPHLRGMAHVTFLNRHVTLHVTPGFGVTPRVTFFNRGVTPT